VQRVRTSTHTREWMQPYSLAVLYLCIYNAKYLVAYFGKISFWENIDFKAFQGVYGIHCTVTVMPCTPLKEAVYSLMEILINKQ